MEITAMRRIALVLWAATSYSGALAGGQQKPLIFEAEDWTTPKDAWNEDKYSETKWNLWSTDRDAARKWSGGAVLQSPRVLKDRDNPEDGGPVLHTHITGIPSGRWEVYLRNVGRVLAVSLDGKEWRPVSGVRAYLGLFEISNGTFDLWVDDRYAAPTKPGSAYYDCLEFDPLSKRVVKPKVVGWTRERLDERIDRGLVAMPIEGSRIYLGWRLLAKDSRQTAFNLYRSKGNGEPVKINPQPVSKTTDFIDASPLTDGDLTYVVRPVTDGKEGASSERAVVRAGSTPTGYLSIKLAGSYTFQKVGIADLNDDGKYDFVIKQPNSNVDPYDGYWHKSPGTYKIEAYLSDGTFLWRNDLGWSIEQGIWYSPYLVYDFDGDGKAEVAVKTGEGDPRDPNGRVMSGPEYLSIWDGMTGKEKVRVNWPSRQGFPAYNYASRNQLGVAFLDGKTPCLIVARGTYNTMKVVAYQYYNGRLKELWQWNNTEDGRQFYGQGAHFMHCADVDGDGRDEVILGSAVLDDNGNGLWSTGLRHPDHCYVGDIDPTRPGLEIYYGIEPGRAEDGMCLVDAKTGRVLWGLKERTYHVHSSGLCADIDPNHVGMECYGGEAEKEPRGKNRRWLFTSKGELLATEKTWDQGCAPRSVYWDADPYRELLINKVISKFGGHVLTRSIEGSQAAWADILGDWREEIITSIEGELRIYTTTIPATDRRICLMQDRIHRIDVAHLSMGYPQPPMTSYCLSATAANR
jgi:rhamnogalacturonan endolyase